MLMAQQRQLNDRLVVRRRSRRQQHDDDDDDDDDDAFSSVVVVTETGTCGHVDSMDDIDATASDSGRSSTIMSTSSDNGIDLSSIS